MCIPFKWGLSGLLDLLLPIRQFRALGRFSWIFYYVMTVYTAWLIYEVFQQLKQNNRTLPGVALVTAAVISMGYSAKLNTERATRNLFNNNDKLENYDTEYLARFTDSGIKSQEFQAILALPFSSTNGDKLLFERGLTAMTEAMKCSYHTGIPLIQSFSPRLSFEQSLSSIQLLADSAIYKDRLDDMTNHPILLLTTRQELNEREQWLKDQSTTFWEDKYICLSILPVDVFRKSHDNWLKSVRTKTYAYTNQDGISASCPLNEVVYKDFDEEKSTNSFAGQGAIHAKRGELELFNGIIPAPTDTATLSFWLYFDTRAFDMPQVLLDRYDENDALIKSWKLKIRESHDVYKQWIRVETQLTDFAGKLIRLRIKGKYMCADNLLIQPQNSAVNIQRPNQKEQYNNFIVE